MHRPLVLLQGTVGTRCLSFMDASAGSAISDADTDTYRKNERKLHYLYFALIATLATSPGEGRTPGARVLLDSILRH